MNRLSSRGKGENKRRAGEGVGKGGEREGFMLHRTATNNPNHFNSCSAVPTHFNIPDHSIADMCYSPGITAFQKHSLP